MKKLIALFFLTVYTSFSFACSTFLLSRNGQHVFGRNYDWVTGNGMVMVNARGVQKTSFAPEGGKTLSWVSGCGSITFNQYGKEFPHGGMNEKGLVVELMWLSDTKYPDADERAALNELQWIQYQLDNCATVEEVIATDSLIRINRQEAAPLHYLVADALGNSATIEFINGKMVVHKGKDLPHPVLTNTPYNEALQQVKGKEGQTSFGDNSVDRFATACRMVQQFQKAPQEQNPVDYAFKMLQTISMGSYTKWSIVYDITNRKIAFITSDQKKRKQFSFADFDFSCTGTTLAFPMNSSKAGAIAGSFLPLSYDQNKKLLEQTARESVSQIQVPAEAIAAAAQYYHQPKCSK